MSLGSIVKQGSDLYFLYTFLKRLTTPFEETKAFKLGIIDKDGKVLRKRSTLKTSEEKNSYTIMDTMIFNIKKIMAKVPFGKTKLFSYAASLFLLKEQKKVYGYLLNEEKLQTDLTKFYNSLNEEDLKKAQVIIKQKGKTDLDKDPAVKKKEDDEKEKEREKEQPPEDKPDTPDPTIEPDDDADSDLDAKVKQALKPVDDEDDEEDEEEVEEDAPAGSTGGIAGAGDDSSTVPVGKNAQKRIRRRNRVANIMRLRREASWNQITKRS